MSKELLISIFTNWLKENSTIKLMHLYEFAEYEIDRLLEAEAPGYKLYEDSNIFIGRYEYEFTIEAKHSRNGKANSFCFESIGFGIKDNVTENDYELSEYTELIYIVK